MSEWTALFNLIFQAKQHWPGTGLSITENDLRLVSTAENEVKKQPFTPFPKKRKIDKEEKPEVMDIPTYTKIFKPESEYMQDPEKFKMEFVTTTIIGAFLSMEARLQELAKVMESLKEVVEFNEGNVADLATQANVDLTTLFSEIGEKPSFSEEIDSPSLWTSINMAHKASMTQSNKAMELITTKVKDIYKKQESKQGFLQQRMGSLEQQLKHDSDQGGLQQCMVSLERQLKDMEMFAQTVMRTLKTYTSKLNLLETRLPQGGISGPTQAGSVFAQAAAQLNMGTSNTYDMQTSSTLSPTTAQATISADSGIIDRLNELEKRLEKVVRAGEDGAIKYYSLGFRSFEESCAWLETNHAANDFGLVVDPHILMEKIYRQVTEVDYLKTMNQAHKLEPSSCHHVI